jgi:hypothetical protein
MKTQSLVRLANYAMIIAIVVLSRRQILSIPVHMLGEDESEMLFSEPERLKESGAIVNTVGFTDSTRSGAQVASIAMSELRKRSIDPTGFRKPVIRLAPTKNRLFWTLHYMAHMGPWQFVLTIDDATGDVRYEDTTAPM